MSAWYIGTIGFSYKDWVGPFYQAGTSQLSYLAYYSKYFNSVEIDTTFHAVPRQSVVQSWMDNTPNDFTFCIKTPRQITHELGLINTEGFLYDFLESLKPLAGKLGPILIQLPPRFDQSHFDTLSSFLSLLPKTNRFAIEFRHASWYNQKTIDLLTKNDICFVSIDYPKLPRDIIPTTRYCYVRWIGINNLFHHHSFERVDKSSELKKWYEMMKLVESKVDEIYGYFNNDYTGFGAGTCLRFKQIAGLASNEEGTFYQERFL